MKNNQLFIEMCEKIAQQTDHNDHTGAKITCAKFFKYDQFTRIFEAIDRIHVTEGFLPGDVGNYRCAKGKELLSLIESEHGKEIKELVYKSF